MRRLLIALVVSCLPVTSFAATFYVTATGAGDTDGTSYANAWAGWSDITMASINAGDTLRVCGVHNSSTTLSFTRAGTVGVPITITGICPEEGGQTGILDGNLTAIPVLQLSQAGQDASYVDVQDITIRNGRYSGAGGSCVRVSSLGAGPGGNVIDRVTFTTCETSVDVQKPGVTVRNSTISEMGDDGVGGNGLGSDIVFEGNHISNFSTLTTGGDGIAVSESASGSVTIRNNTILFQNLNSLKQGIIAGRGASGKIIIEGNRIIGSSAYANNHGISVVSGGQVYVRNNIISGMRACVTHFSNSAELLTTLYVYGNECRDSVYGVLLTTTLSTPTLNVYNNTGVDIDNGLRATTTVAATIKHSNNIWSLRPGSIGQALYVGAGHASYEGNANILTPAMTSYIQNFMCGGSIYSTAAGYKAACVMEDRTGDYDPMFYSKTDARVLHSSPAHDIGVWWGNECVDVRGRPCFPGQVDIGAYQHSSGDDAGPRELRD